MKRIYSTALVLGLALALLITFSPVLAHPYWDDEAGEQVIPPWMGGYEDIPYWYDNETFQMPHWYNNGTIPEGYYNEDGVFCPGPYIGYTEAPEGEDAPVYPRGGYGCGMGGRGFRGGSRNTPRGPTGWSG